MTKTQNTAGQDYPSPAHISYAEDSRWCQDHGHTGLLVGSVCETCDTLVSADARFAAVLGTKHNPDGSRATATPAPPAWVITGLGRGEYLVTGPEGTYEVAAHLEYTSNPIPENDVVIDQITSGGKVLHNGRRIMPGCSYDANVTMLVEDAVLTAEGR